MCVCARVCVSDEKVVHHHMVGRRCCAHYLPRHDLVDGGKGIFSLFWEARVMSGRGHSFCLDQFRWVVGFGWKGGGGDIEVGS